MAGNPLCHFEIGCSDVERTQTFYGKVFDWSFEAFPGGMEYSLIKTGREPEGGLMKKPDQAPHPYLQTYFLVESIEATLERVREAGGKVVFERTEVPNVGAWALFTDPDGIPVGIFEGTAETPK